MCRALAGLVVGLALVAPSAHAFPFLSLRPGGTPFEGPADVDATSLWWNPAGLGLLQGLQVVVTGRATVSRGEVARAPIRSDSGLPGAGADRTFPAQSMASDNANGFVALLYNFNENITLAVGGFAPWVSCPLGGSCRIGPRGDDRAHPGSSALPGGYHLASESFTHVYFSFAGAVRISSKIHIGIAVAIVDSAAHLAFYRDTALDLGSAGVKTGSALCGGAACGHEDPRAAQRIEVSGDGGTWGGIPLPTGVATSLGVLTRPWERVFIGASWQRVFPLASADGLYVASDGIGARVTPAPGADASATCGGGPCTGGDALLYYLPDVWHLGARIVLPRRLELSTWGRLVMYGGYTGTDARPSGLVVRLSGDVVTRARAPSQIIVDHGFQPAFATELGLRWRPVESLRLGVSAVFESSAVRRDLVSAEALDAPKVQGLVGAEWQAARWLRLRAAFGVTALFPTETTPGGFDPGATVRCVDARYASDACVDANAGRGLPSAAGRYTRFDYDFTAGVALKY